MANTTPPLNPSPKQKFISSETNVKAHRHMVDSQEFERALHYATLEYQRVLCENSTDMSAAAASHFRLKGAQEFVHVLRNLSETPRILSAPAVGNLDHNS